MQTTFTPLNLLKKGIVIYPDPPPAAESSDLEARVKAIEDRLNAPLTEVKPIEEPLKKRKGWFAK